MRNRLGTARCSCVGSASVKPSMLHRPALAQPVPLGQCVASRVSASCHSDHRCSVTTTSTAGTQPRSVPTPPSTHTSHVFPPMAPGSQCGAAIMQPASVPVGSVGIAGTWCGVYPTASPGGWRLLGRTDATLWDPSREHPALLPPGTRVRFVSR